MHNAQCIIEVCAKGARYAHSGVSARQLRCRRGATGKPPTRSVRRMRDYPCSYYVGVAYLQGGSLVLRGYTEGLSSRLCRLMRHLDPLGLQVLRLS